MPTLACHPWSPDTPPGVPPSPPKPPLPLSTATTRWRTKWSSPSTSPTSSSLRSSSSPRPKLQRGPCHHPDPHLPALTPTHSTPPAPPPRCLHPPFGNLPPHTGPLPAFSPAAPVLCPCLTVPEAVVQSCCWHRRATGAPLEPRVASRRLDPPTPPGTQGSSHRCGSLLFTTSRERMRADVGLPSSWPNPRALPGGGLQKAKLTCERGTKN